MSSAPAKHIASVLAAPLPGVYTTHLDSGHEFGRHWHDAYGFGYIERGAQSWASGRGTVRGYAGDVITTNPGEVHDGKPLGAATRRWRILYMDAAAMESFARTPEAHAVIARPVIADHELRAALQRVFRRIERWNQSHSSSDALACEESLAETCTTLMARHGSTPFEPRVADADMRRVRERLADDTRHAPTLAELAQTTGLSRYQVLRRFEQAYGLPPHAWLLRRRVERARVLIAGGVALSAAAWESGFADQSHMTRTFARQFGFTPGALRRAAQRHT